MSRYREQVAAVLRVVSVRPGPRYAWLGRVDRALSPAILESLSMGERRAHLVDSLTEELYASFYTQGEPAASRRGERGPLSGERQLMRALADANAGQGGWESGWTVEREGDSRVVLRGQRLRIVARREEFQAGAGLRVAKDLPERSPGYYTALGDAGSGGDVRVYWNVGPAAAAQLMRVLTERLNGLGVAFAFKVADHPARFSRCDSAVLYVAGEVLGELRDIRARLRPRTPALTLTLCAGVGAAEHPPDGASFGLTRCRVLAEGIVRAYELRAQDRLAVVERVFDEHGMDLDAPYREPSRERHVL
jgi:hypothetical protein